MKIGVIGGSGVYELEGLESVSMEFVETPFGPTSDEYVHGFIDGREIYFLPRHGRGHTILPSEINHRANVFGMKMLGVERVVSISAVGSLQEAYRPRDIVLPDQYFDRTKKSLEHTFFGNGVVAHVGFGEPTCRHMRAGMADAARRVIEQRDPPVDVRVKDGGTYVNMEGPAFSTKAESHAYRAMGCDVIGMTSLPEAKLCREAEICYQSLAMVTDYDCWHESEEDVTVEMVIGHLQANSSLAKDILRELLVSMPASRDCGCGSALSTALITRPEQVSAEMLERLGPIIGKYVS